MKRNLILASALFASLAQAGNDPVAARKTDTPENR